MVRIRIRKSAACAALAAGLVSGPLLAQERVTAPPGSSVNIVVKPTEPAAPPASFVLGLRHGHVTPIRHGCTHTGGGNIDVAQPSPDTVIITMAGAAVAYGSVCDASAVMSFDLEQCLEVNLDNPKVKKVKVTLEGRVIGLLRGYCKGDGAAYENACAGLGCDATSLVHLCVPPHSVGGCESLSVNDHDGPVSVPIPAGKYTYHQTFAVSALAAHHIVPCKGPSAEFAPDPAIDPLWLPYKEPFHGAAKKDFGFQVTLKLVEDTDTNGNGNGKEKEEEKTPPAREKLPPPTPEPAALRPTLFLPTAAHSGRR